MIGRPTFASTVAAALSFAWSGAAMAQQPGPARGISSLEQSAQPAPAAPSNALDKKDLEFYLRHLYLWGPHITVEIGDFTPAPIEGLLETTVQASYQQASQERVIYVSNDGRHILEGRRFEIANNPFDSTLQKITTADQPSFGTAGAPVVIVAYSDFQCPYCAKEAKMLRSQLLAAYPEQVRVFFRDYPLKTHNWAREAAIVGQCFHRFEPLAFWEYHDWIFENQSNITPENLKTKAAEFGGGQNVDGMKLAQCIEKRETESLVDQSIEEGRAIGVTSTPTIFLNGRKLAGSIGWEELKQIIDYELNYQKVTKNAGDNCGCEISLPFPE